jgi:hypothetical protein
MVERQVIPKRHQQITTTLYIITQSSTVVIDNNREYNYININYKLLNTKNFSPCCAINSLSTFTSRVRQIWPLSFADGLGQPNDQLTTELKN